MTPRQSFAIFAMSKIDVRGTNLTMAQASNFIDRLKKGETEAARSELMALEGAIVKGEIKPKQDWQALYNKADAAGKAAALACIPTPMVVCAQANPLDPQSPATIVETVPEGVCGFASINVKPANGSFGLWLKKQGLARHDGYHGGMCIWVSDYNQSYELKTAYAYAFAKVLQEAGIKAYAQSNLD